MLLQMYGVDTMTSLLKSSLENEKARYETLLKQGRTDAIALFVLHRLHQEIQKLHRRIEHEERARKEVDSRTSTSGFTQCFGKALDRFRLKRNTNHYSIPAIPTIETL